jgi:hypothetical protein
MMSRQRNEFFLFLTIEMYGFFLHFRTYHELAGCSEPVTIREKKRAADC